MAVQGTTTQRPWVAPVASLALVGLGIFLLKVCVYDVLEAAKRHEATVSLSFKGVLVAPVFIAVGVVASVVSFSGAGVRQGTSGWSARFTNPHTRRLSPLGWGIAFALLGAGGLLYVWLQSQLRALGYDV